MLHTYSIHMKYQFNTEIKKILHIFDVHIRYIFLLFGYKWCIILMNIHNTLQTFFCTNSKHANTHIYTMLSPTHTRTHPTLSFGLKNESTALSMIVAMSGENYVRSQAYMHARACAESTVVLITSS